MLRTLVLLCLVAAPALGVWEGALKEVCTATKLLKKVAKKAMVDPDVTGVTSTVTGQVKFGLSVFGIGSDVFIELPLTERDVMTQRWVHLDRPQGPAGLEVLHLWCSPNDYTVCVLLDDTGYIGGMQVAVNEEQFTDSIFDWTALGFTYWTVADQDGTTKNYWTTQQYYISAESLTIDPTIRIANRDASLMLQDEAIWVSGFNGSLYAISTNVSDIRSESSDFTKQACIPWMGEHYYYKMSEDLECRVDTLLPWFPLVANDQLIGVGLIMFGKHSVTGDNRNWFELPGSTAVKAIVPRGPECLYDLADSPGLVTLHTYFIRHPYLLTCVF